MFFLYFLANKEDDDDNDDTNIYNSTLYNERYVDENEIIVIAKHKPLTS